MWARLAVSMPCDTTICARMARSRILVGLRGLEPRTSAVDRTERCANESGAASESHRVMWCTRDRRRNSYDGVETLLRIIVNRDKM
jgi:hypothetical protein